MQQQIEAIRTHAFGETKKILEVERTCNNDEKYIPIGTKWVFLKGYENAESLIVWGASDMQDYTNDMAKSIYRMLGGEIK